MRVRHGWLWISVCTCRRGRWFGEVFCFCGGVGCGWRCCIGYTYGKGVKSEAIVSVVLYFMTAACCLEALAIGQVNKLNNEASQDMLSICHSIRRDCIG